MLVCENAVRLISCITQRGPLLKEKDVTTIT
jgi:hypothetical protein